MLKLIVTGRDVGLNPGRSAINGDWRKLQRNLSQDSQTRSWDSVTIIFVRKQYVESWKGRTADNKRTSPRPIYLHRLTMVCKKISKSTCLRNAYRLCHDIYGPRRSLINLTVPYMFNYSHAPHTDVSVNDGPHIRWYSHKIIILHYNIKLPLCYNCLQYSVQLHAVRVCSLGATGYAK